MLPSRSLLPLIFILMTGGCIHSDTSLIPPGARNAIAAGDYRVCTVDVVNNDVKNERECKAYQIIDRGQLNYVAITNSTDKKTGKAQKSEMPFRVHFFEKSGGSFKGVMETKSYSDDGFVYLFMQYNNKFFFVESPQCASMDAKMKNILRREGLIRLETNISCEVSTLKGAWYAVRAKQNPKERGKRTGFVAVPLNDENAVSNEPPRTASPKAAPVMPRLREE